MLTLLASKSTQNTCQNKQSRHNNKDHFIAAVGAFPCLSLHRGCAFSEEGLAVSPSCRAPA